MQVVVIPAACSLSYVWNLEDTVIWIRYHWCSCPPRTGPNSTFHFQLQNSCRPCTSNEYTIWIIGRIALVSGKIDCAKRSFRPWAPDNLMFVSQSVSLIVQKIIDFCEGDMEGASLLLSTHSLNFWFWRIQKWTPLKKVKSWYRPVQGPLFGPSFWNFLARC